MFGRTIIGIMVIFGLLSSIVCVTLVSVQAVTIRPEVKFGCGAFTVNCAKPMTFSSIAIESGYVQFNATRLSFTAPVICACTLRYLASDTSMIGQMLSISVALGLPARVTFSFGGLPVERYFTLQVDKSQYRHLYSGSEGSIAKQASCSKTSMVSLLLEERSSSHTVLSGPLRGLPESVVREILPAFASTSLMPTAPPAFQGLGQGCLVLSLLPVWVLLRLAWGRE